MQWSTRLQAESSCCSICDLKTVQEQNFVSVNGKQHNLAYSYTAGVIFIFSSIEIQY